MTEDKDKITKELQELGTLVNEYDALKAANDKAEKPKYVAPNRRDRRAAKRKKAGR